MLLWELLNFWRLREVEVENVIVRYYVTILGNTVVTRVVRKP